MLCPNCQQEFDQNSHLPRILVSCGHTYCQECIERLLERDQEGDKYNLKCPECKVVNQVIDGVNSFPKNLVLLQVNKPQQNSSKTNLEQNSNEANKSQQESHQDAFCGTHSKKLEAFCEKDQELLCIDCILSDQHKSHEIISLQKAVEKQKKQMFDDVGNAQKLEEKLKLLSTDIHRHISDMQEQADRNRDELSQIYSFLREMLLEREQTLKRSISDNLSREESECQSKIKEINQIMSLIHQMKGELVQQSQEQELELLSKAKQRNILSQEVNGQKSKELINYNISSVAANHQSMIEIKKEQELTCISKITHPSFKGNPSQYGNAQSTLYSHTASTANKQRKGQGALNNNAYHQNSLNNIESKLQREDPYQRKATKTQNKNKLSPNRNSKKNEKRQNVMILDQNKANKNNKSNKGTFVNVALNQNNYNQSKNQEKENEDNQDNEIAPDDVSSIYPLETNECYYNYSPQNNKRGKERKRKESGDNLDRLLDCLNKSNGENQDHQQQDVHISTASDSQEMVQKVPQLKTAKSNIDTPKDQRVNCFANKQNNHQVKQLKKENSGSEFDNNRNLQQFKMQSPIKAKQINLKGENSGKQRSESLNRLQLQKFNPQHSDSNINLESQTIDNRFSQAKRQNQLQCLSQERKKRKELKYENLSSNNSPQKEQQDSQKQEQSSGLLQLIKECSSNIQNLEFRHSKKKPSVTTSESPNKKSFTVVKQVNLSLKEEIRGEADEEPLKLVNELSPKIPQQQLQKKMNQEYQSKSQDYKVEEQDLQNEQEQEVDQKENYEYQSVQRDTQENKEECNVQTNSSQQQMSSNFSVDTSVADPFRGLCKMREEFLFVFSGFNESKLLQCEAFDVQRGIWKEIAQVMIPRTKFSAVPISKSRILLFGGKQSDGQRTGEIEEFNIKTNKFKMLPFKMPKPRSGFAACVKKDEGKIFFCGGNSGSVLKKFDCLDLKKGKWSRLPEMHQKRDELAVALGPDGNIYAIGGYGGGSQCSNQEESSNEKQKSTNTNCLNTAERFNFTTQQWEMLPEMNQTRRALAAVALPDGIYAIGGYDGKQYLSSVEKFDLQQQKWVTVKSMNTSRCTLAAVASSDFQYIYALGGFNGNALDLVERYNIMNDEWEFITPMNTKRFMHEAVNLVTQSQ